MPNDLVRLTYLDLLRGFVAVGRRMSITQAAEDLCLSQSAVSRQIRSLEQQLGTQLFIRGHRSLTFTTAGEQLFLAANDSLKKLAKACDSVARSDGDHLVTISTSVGVSGLWLLPKLGSFKQEYPDIDIRVEANNQKVDLLNENVDLAIRYCTAEQAPPGAVKLFDETLLPVVGQDYVVDIIDDPRQLSEHTLLELDSRLDLTHSRQLQWCTWLAANNWSDSEVNQWLCFNQYDQLIRAAADGQGIALGRLELLQPMLEEQRLRVVEGSFNVVSTGLAFWLILPSEPIRHKVSLVAEWLKQQASQQLRLVG